MVSSNTYVGRRSFTSWDLCADFDPAQPLENFHSNEISDDFLAQKVEELNLNLTFNEAEGVIADPVEQLQEKKAPWACRYCGIDDPKSVVRCMESNFWFCNSTGGTDIH